MVAGHLGVLVSSELVDYPSALITPEVAIASSEVADQTNKKSGRSIVAVARFS